MNSDERERLKRIRERRGEAKRLAWMDHPPQPTWRDIDFLLSQLNSQAADGEVAIGYSAALKFVNAWLWNPPDFGSADRSTDQTPWHEPYKQDAAQMVVAAHNRAATRMRGLCVEKVKEKRGMFLPLSLVGDPYQRGLVEGLETAIRAIQSLTLDQVEEK